MCVDRRSRERLACKTIAKSHTAEELAAIRNELIIHDVLSGHPNLVRLDDVYENEQQVTLLFFFCCRCSLPSSVCTARPRPFGCD